MSSTVIGESNGGGECVYVDLTSYHLRPMIPERGLQDRHPLPIPLPDPSFTVISVCDGRRICMSLVDAGFVPVTLHTHIVTPPTFGPTITGC